MFETTPSFSPREITIQLTITISKPVTGQRSTLKEHATSMSCKPKPAIGSRDIGQRIRLVVIIVNLNNTYRQRYSYGSGDALLVFKVVTDIVTLDCVIYAIVTFDQYLFFSSCFPSNCQYNQTFGIRHAC